MVPVSANVETSVPIRAGCAVTGNACELSVDAAFALWPHPAVAAAINTHAKRAALYETRFAIVMVWLLVFSLICSRRRCGLPGEPWRDGPDQPQNVRVDERLVPGSAR